MCNQGLLCFHRWALHSRGCWTSHGGSSADGGFESVCLAGGSWPWRCRAGGTWCRRATGQAAWTQMQKSTWLLLLDGLMRWLCYPLTIASTGAIPVWSATTDSALSNGATNKFHVRTRVLVFATDCAALLGASCSCELDKFSLPSLAEFR